MGPSLTTHLTHITTLTSFIEAVDRFQSSVTLSVCCDRVVNDDQAATMVIVVCIKHFRVKQCKNSANMI